MCDDITPSTNGLQRHNRERDIDLNVDGLWWCVCVCARTFSLIKVMLFYLSVGHNKHEIFIFIHIRHRISFTQSGTESKIHTNTQTQCNGKTCSQTSSTGRFNFWGVEQFITSTSYAIFAMCNCARHTKWLASISLRRIWNFGFSLSNFWHEIYLLNHFPDECLTYILCVLH